MNISKYIFYGISSNYVIVCIEKLIFSIFSKVFFFSLLSMKSEPATTLSPDQVPSETKPMKPNNLQDTQWLISTNGGVKHTEPGGGTQGLDEETAERSKGRA